MLRIQTNARNLGKMLISDDTVSLRRYSNTRARSLKGADASGILLDKANKPALQPYDSKHCISAMQVVCNA